MKKITLLTLLLITAFVGYSQNAYYDALVLSHYLRPDGTLDQSIDSIYLILDQYVSPNTVNTPAQIKTALNTDPTGKDPNPFIEIAAGAQGEHRRAGFITGAVNAAGNLQVTNLADGLAQFLIERSKQELSVAFFDQFKNDLKKYPELKVLFPTTSQFIDNIESYNYTSFLQTLREAFLSDLTALPTGLRNLRMLTTADCNPSDSKCIARIGAIQNFFTTNDLSALFVATTILMEKLQYGASIPTILTAIANDPQISRDVIPVRFPNSNITNAFLLADIFSRSLQSRTPDRVWITGAQFKRLADPKVLRLYFGLIYQECLNKNITFQTAAGTTVALTSLLTPAQVNAYFRYLEGIIGATEQVNSIAADIREKKQSGEKFGLQDYVGYLNSSVDVVSALVHWDDLGVNLPQQQIESILSTTRSAISVYYNIRSENYASAISNTVIIIEKTLGNNYTLKEKVLRYGSFTASIVQAESAEEVKAAIEAVALPVGSASIKKNVPLNIALNAYLGGLWGEEYLADKQSNKWKQTTGIAAPIGITVSTRVRNWSVSAFGSLIDLGAVVSYRLKDDSTKNLPDLKLQNIFAPGYGLVIGIPKVPLSVGYMRQLGPALREINAGSATVSNSLNNRWYFFLAVDIPLVNFYTIPRRKD